MLRLMIVKINRPVNHLRILEEPTLKHLVIQAQKSRDAEAFILLMEQNRQSMLKTAKAFLSNEEDVADVIQDTILTCYEKLDTLKQPEFFKTWLIRILINKCKDCLRKNRELHIPEEYTVPGHTQSLSSNYEFRELLASLDEKYRSILVLYYSEGFNIREIAQLLELNEHTVKSRLARARKKFAEEYQKEGGKIYG